MRRVWASLVGVLLSGTAWAAAIDVGAPKGAERTAGVDRKSELYPLPVAPFGGKLAPLATVEGEARWAAYRLADGSTEGVIAGYRDRLVTKGFEVVLDCAGRACGGFDFRFGVKLLPPPAMQMDVADFAQLSLRRVDPPSVVSVLASQVRGVVHIQTVSVVPADGDVSLAPRPVAATPELETRAAPAAVADDVTEAPKQTFYEQLTSRGHLIISGVAFATGGAKISSTSGPALDQVAEMLTEHSDLSVAIVGHSDNQGGLNANIALSQRRANAVMQALISRGIAANRMEAMGIGYLAPLQANTTPEGRAVNRRVELVVR